MSDHCLDFTGHGDMCPLTRLGGGWKHRLSCALAAYPTKQPQHLREIL
ncbi:MAG: hypothetical protein GY805_01635 [Chloroflexi bacterium]|nr:hypothetical protein [Chloroflexota bacterium]